MSMQKKLYSVHYINSITDFIQDIMNEQNERALYILKLDNNLM